MKPLIREMLVAFSIIFCAMMCGLWIKPAAAAELTPVQAASLYAIASGLSGLPLADKAPVIHMVDAAVVRSKACPTKEPERCPVFGIFTEGEIWMDKSLDYSDPEVAAVVLHEMVHFLQYVARGPTPPTCHAWLERERQAYQVQLLALKRIGASTFQVGLVARSLGCS